MEKLLDASVPNGEEYITILDQTIGVLQKHGPQFQQASSVLTRLKGDPNSWRRVAFILEKSGSDHTRFFALQILEEAIARRWKTIPIPEQANVKKYIINKIVTLSKNEALMRQHKRTVNKMNICLVHILKHEWPHNWKGFIPEIVKSSMTSESLCENNVHILKLLSEEVFEYAKGEMTMSKTLTMKQQLKSEFQPICKLLKDILMRSKKASLISVTLKTLQRFITWVPLEFIFETDIIKMLLNNFFAQEIFRNDVLGCLTEISGLIDTFPVVRTKYVSQVRQLFVFAAIQISRVLPAGQDLRRVVEFGSEEYRCFIRGLSLFCTAIISPGHIDIFEGHDRPLGTATCREAVIQTLQYIVRISEVDDKEIFKICIEFWHGFTKTLYGDYSGKQGPASRFAAGGGFGNGDLHSVGGASARIQTYEPTLSKVRVVMIEKMAKPEEVLIEQDERGEIVRQATKDTDAIALYKTMRETIVYLTHLNSEDSENIMIDKLSKQVDGSEWSWNNLNRLCWAIGSISMTMNSDDEKRFLVTVIKDLLGLCEKKRGKDNKAVIASNIMYVVGQYPRFLKAHWRFLKTVVNKLFEFMHELHPGVQDMACDTFLKISKKCRTKFVEKQIGEREPYIQELLRSLGSIISELQSHQELVFYEAVGFMIGSEKNQSMRNDLLFAAMSIPDQTWKTLMRNARTNVDSLKTHDNIKRVSRVLRVNLAMCRSLGHSFMPYLGKTYNDMLNVYQLYSEHVKSGVARVGASMMHDPTVRLMRVAKKEVLQLIELFIEKSSGTHAQMVANTFLPPLLKPVLADYNASIPLAREPSVLSLLTTMVNKLKGHMNAHVPIAMNAVFEVTLKMLSSNFEDFPEIRHNFFALLKAIVWHCFPAIFQTPPAMQMAVVTSIVGAMKHTERIVAEMGLDVLHKFLQQVLADDRVAQTFFKSFYLKLLREVLVILTDRLHKSGFPKQAVILQYMFGLLTMGKIRVQLGNGPDNLQIVMQFVMQNLAELFPMMSKTEIQNFVKGAFTAGVTLEQFKQGLHDFLIHTKEWSQDKDNSAMYASEQQSVLEAQKRRDMQMKKAVPGLLNPHELDDLDDI
eukprot:g4618.t1